MALYTERAMNHDQIADELMGLKTFRDNEVLYEDLGDGRRAFSGLKRISIRTLRKRISTIPFEIDFEKQSQDGSCTIIFGVAPKSDSNGSIGRPASLIDGRGSSRSDLHCIQTSQRRCLSMAGHDPRQF